MRTASPRRGRRFLVLLLAVAFALAGFRSGEGLYHHLRGSFSLGEGLLSSTALWLPTVQEGSGQELPSWEGRERVNFLLLGLDRRPGEEACRADTIMVASLEPLTKKAVLLSIPRDLWVSIPGYGEGRINTAHFLGELEGSGGPQLTAQTIGANFGIPIHHYVSLDFEGFKKAIEIMGGVEVEVPLPIQDDQFPDENYGYQSIYIPAGRQLMDGERLLQYVRTRHGNGDFDRMRRQQQVLRALAEKALHLDLRRLPQLLATLRDALSTDLEPLEVLALANLARDIGLEGVEMRAIDESLTTPFTTWDGAQILLPDKAGIQALLQELFTAPSTTQGSEGEEGKGEGDLKIVVRNGTGEVGRAGEVAQFLDRRGYEVRDYGDLYQNAIGEMVIVTRRDRVETARHLAGLLKIDQNNVILVHSPEEEADIIILLGSPVLVPAY